MEFIQGRRTHPLVLGAAASVMMVSLLGAAALTGLLPSARSEKPDAAAQTNSRAVDSAPHTRSKLPAYANECNTCATVESIRSVEVKGEATGLGAVAGGLTGGVLGNQMGRGNGNTAMTILGVAGGALAGNEIEKNVHKRYSYRVTVRLDDGSFRTLPQNSAPRFAVGERVRIVDGAVVAGS